MSTATIYNLKVDVRLWQTTGKIGESPKLLSACELQRTNFTMFHYADDTEDWALDNNLTTICG